MLKDGMYEINKMLELERENARLRTELKKKERRIALLEAKLKNQRNTNYTDKLGGDDLDLIYILARR